MVAVDPLTLFAIRVAVLLLGLSILLYAGYHIRKSIKRRGYATPTQQMACGGGCVLLTGAALVSLLLSLSVAPWFILLFPVLIIIVAIAGVKWLRHARLANIATLYHQHLAPNGHHALLVYHDGTPYTAAIEKQLIPELDETWASVKLPEPPNCADRNDQRGYYSRLGAIGEPLQNLALLLMPNNAMLSAAWFVVLRDFPEVKRSELERPLTPAEIESFRQDTGAGSPNDSGVASPGTFDDRKFQRFRDAAFMAVSTEIPELEDFDEPDEPEAPLNPSSQ